MATKLKHDDFVRTATPTPNIRIAFENGPAVVAINRALSDAPASHATLDELNGGASLRDVMIRRNELMEQIDKGPELAEAPLNDAIAAIHACENAIIKAPARTPDDALIKLIAVAQVSAEGHVIDDAEAAQAIAEGRKHFGIGFIGSVHGLPAADVAPGQIALSAGPTPFAIIYARHAAALEHFENLPEPRSHEQDDADAAAYCAASVALDHAEPTNWTEFAQKVEHVLNDQTDELYTRLIADAKRLRAVRS